MNKISLCLIVGNVEDYIERCLKSFLPIASEVCLVRAIGNQTPDRTFEIAASVMEGRGIPIKTAEYKNAVANSEWNHVDDFSKARQKSFDIASNDWCMWVDTDDILEKGAETILELSQDKELDAALFPYNIFGQGLNLPRERLVRKSKGKWNHPVHECFDFTNPINMKVEMDVVITHLPHLTKRGGHERNLRILRSIPLETMNPGLIYHFQCELSRSGNVIEAQEVAKVALANKDIGPSERCEIFMNLFAVAKDPKTKEALLHHAYAADPRRREALGLLVGHSLDYGKNEHAISYARQMMATPTPRDRTWNHRQSLYSWLGDEVYCQALRGNGLFTEAEYIRRESLKRAGGPRIALIHATRGRPQQAAKARKLWFDYADKPEQVEHIFVSDADDILSQSLERFHRVVIPSGGGCVAAWNAGVHATEADIIIAIADDVSPCLMWDKIIMDRLDPKSQKVLSVSDGHRTDKLICHPIFTRAYWRMNGHLYNPRFKSMFCDNWFTEQAYARRAVIEAKDVVFEHNHPAFGTAKMDRTYADSNHQSRYEEGFNILEDLRKTLGNGAPA